jgi:hypothetical protein
MHVHLVFVTKYRRDVPSELARRDLKTIFAKVCPAVAVLLRRLVRRRSAIRHRRMHPQPTRGCAESRSGNLNPLVVRLMTVGNMVTARAFLTSASKKESPAAWGGTKSTRQLN